MSIRVVQIPVLDDNYNYLLVHDERGEAIAIDPSLGEPILNELKVNNLKIIEIWNTHHHWDHIGGNEDIAKSMNARVVRGPLHEKIPERTLGLVGGEKFRIWNIEVDVLSTPGHTLHHIAYHVPSISALFSGDVLFSMGCGRLFEGTPEQMAETLDKIRRLPGSTLIYGAHEYSHKNSEFALQFEPNNSALVERHQRVLELRSQGLSTVPTRLDEELSYNPFLRTHSREIRACLNLEQGSDIDVFATLRSLRNQF